MGKIQVLLVDDEKDYIKRLSARMAEDGIEARVAFSGEEGLEALGEDPPDVLVLDLEMPGMGGMEVLERVRRENPQTQVVILTGRGGPAVEREARAGGAFEVLEKPADYQGLKAVVNRAWGITKKISKAVKDDLVLSFVGDIPVRRRGQTPASGSELRSLPGDGLKVLLVDDNEEFVEGLAGRLEMENLGSEIAFSGEEALSHLGWGVPDVMVLDLNMPGLAGMEVLKRVKEDHPQTEVIILTGYGTKAEEEEALRLGAANYLEKPVEFKDLMSAVRTAGQKARFDGFNEGSK